MHKLIVLIVEDDALLRMDAVGFIEDAGFEAIEAADADAAIDGRDAARAHGARGLAADRHRRRERPRFPGPG